MLQEGISLYVVLLFASVDLPPLPREQLSLIKGLTTLVPCGCFIYALPMFGLHSQKDCFRQMLASLWPLLCPWMPSPYRDALCFLLKSMACVPLPVLQRKLCPNGIISSLEYSYWDSERKSLHYDKGTDEINSGLRVVIKGGGVTRLRTIFWNGETIRLAQSSRGGSFHILTDSVPYRLASSAFQIPCGKWG